MAKLYGFAGKILRVNLTTSKISEVPTSNYVPKYIGARGIATRIYWEEIEPTVEAFDPENKLIFMTGPFQGTTAHGSGRFSLVGKSAKTYPTESIADSNNGGSYAPELKFAGWDGIIVEGKAAKPVYIHIKDGQVSINDAGHLWGLGTYATQEELWKKYGWKTRTLCIGPAGENLSRIGAILTDGGNAFGDGGFGGVMGSKNLKAISVRGTGAIEVADVDKLLELTEYYRKISSVRVGEQVLGYGNKMQGASAMMRSIDPGTYKPDSAIGDLIAQGIMKQSHGACFTCPQRVRISTWFVDKSIPPHTGSCADMSFYAAEEAAYYGTKNPGPLWQLGAALTQDLGFNLSDAGTGLAIIAALVKDGVLTPKNTGWPVDKIGSREFLDRYVNDLAHGKGFGKFCMDGGVRLAEYIATHEEFGPGREKAIYYCELDYPKSGNFRGYRAHHNTLGEIHEYSTLLYWVTAQRDPMDKHTDHDFYCAMKGVGIKVGSDEWKAMVKPMMMKMIGTDKPVDPPGYEDAELAARWWWQQHWEHDCLEFCDSHTCFFRYWSAYVPGDGIADAELNAKFLKAITGWDFTQKTLWAELERPWNLERAIACREGRKPSDDEYNDVWVNEGYRKGNRKHTPPTLKEGEPILDKVKFRELIDRFYALIGWNKNGVPTRARLEQLGLKDVADDLEKRGVS